MFVIKMGRFAKEEKIRVIRQPGKKPRLVRTTSEKEKDYFKRIDKERKKQKQLEEKRKQDIFKQKISEYKQKESAKKAREKARKQREWKKVKRGIREAQRASRETQAKSSELFTLQMFPGSGQPSDKRKEKPKYIYNPRTGMYHKVAKSKKKKKKKKDEWGFNMDDYGMPDWKDLMK